MPCFSPDMTLDAALSDPMVAAAMRADRVDPGHFERLLRAAARDLDVRRSKALPPAAFASRSPATVTGCLLGW